MRFPALSILKYWLLQIAGLETNLYGKIRECNYAEFECMHKGFKMPVKVVLVYMKRLQNSRTFTFADIREEIRKEYTDKSINFDGVCSKTLKRAGNLIMNSFFSEVA